LGFSTIITQILFVREFLNFFYSNELILGIIFSVWMSFVALGAWSGKFIDKIKNKILTVSFLQLFLSILPPLTIFLLRYFRNNFFHSGEAVSINYIIGTSVIFLMFFCFLSGFTFTALCSLYSDLKNENKINTVYYTETIGSVVGGLLFSFFFVYFFKTFEILRILLIFNIICVFLWGVLYKRKMLLLYAVLILLVTIFSMHFDLDKLTKKDFFKAQNIIEDIETPYGNIIITKTSEQINFFQNGLLTYSTGDVTGAEEKVHYTMFQHQSPHDVLLVSGGISGTIQEILKYKNVKLDYVDFNPYAINVAKNYGLIPQRNVNIIIKDPILYLRTTNKKYDVIISDLPEPISAQLNRYYTLEYFNLLKRKLNPEGVISTSLSSSGQYLNEKALSLHSVLYKTMGQVFKNVIIVPGFHNFFIASDGQLSCDFSEKYTRKGIETAYVNPFYIDDINIKRRSSQIQKELDRNVKVNTDFYPIAYFYQNEYWLSFTNQSIYIVLGIIVLILLFMLLRFNALNLCLLTGGFAGTGIEMIIIMSFQIIYGNIYGSIGTIIGIFMAGLAIGAYITQRFSIKNKVIYLVFLQLIIASFATAIILLIYITQQLTSSLMVHTLIYCYTLFFAVLIGAEFTMGVSLLKRSEALIASEIYSADMLGAALGGISVSVFIIPLTGVYYTCLVITFVNAFSGLFLYIKRKKYL